jgi:regulatory protein
MLLIRLVEPVARGARLRIDVGLDEPVEVAAAVCPPIAAGDRIEPARLDALREASDDYDAREAALRLLSYRARTHRELADRLARKGFAAERVARCLGALRDAGMLDDEAYAESHVRDAVRLRPRGSRRLLAELRRKGVAETTAQEVVERVLEQEESPEVDLAARAGEAWARRTSAQDRALLCGRGDRVEVERVRRRFWGYMSRRGFGPDAVRAALERVCA